jgi:hypothetical protein
LNSDDYLKFCQDAYREESRERDQFVTRQGFLLTGIVVLSGLVVQLGTLQRLSLSLVRIDVFLYYLSAIGAFASLATAVVHLILSVCPRVYEQLSDLTEFDRWRNEMRDTLKRSPNGYSEEQIEAIVATETTTALTSRMNEATARNAAQNLTRTKHTNRSLYSVFFAVGFLSLEMLCALVYNLHGG